MYILKIVAITYIIVCTMITVFTPEARAAWKDVCVKLFRDILFAKIESDIFNTLWKRILVLFIMTPIFIFFFISTPYILWTEIKKSKQGEIKIQENKEPKIDVEEETVEKPVYLYFDNIGKTGTVKCLDCDYQENIVSETHRYDRYERPTDRIVGYQCQSCGRMHAIKYPVAKFMLVCSCGGKLSRKNPVFCPKCKSKNMKYYMFF
jgi:hypothetical protein